MAITFRPLPPEAFPENARPYISDLNTTLRELCNLEGTLRNPLTTRRSDNTIARRNVEQVHVTRITPDIANVVSGASTVTGIPVVSYASAGVAGTTTTVIPINATLPFPSALMAVSGNSETVTLTGSGTDSTLTFSSDGGKTIAGGGGSGFALTNPGHSDASNVLNVAGDFDDAMTGLIGANWGAGNLTSKTVRCWDARYPSLPGGFSASTIIGFDTSLFSFTPNSGSSFNNSIYCGRFSGPVINLSASNAFGCSEVATLLLEGMRRPIGSWQGPVTTLGTLILEPPTYAVTATGLPEQIGLYIRQRAAGQVATNRYGIKIDSQNSGTNRFCIYGTSDRAQFTGPLVADGALGITGHATFGNSLTLNGTLGVSGSVAFSGTAANLAQAATLVTGVGAFFGVSGTLGAGTSISNITPADQGRMIYLWAAQGTMGFSVSNTLRVIGNSINVPPNGAVQAFCTGTTWFVFSPSS